MNQDMMEALQALAVERGISVDALFGALADALEHAYKRMPGFGLHVADVVFESEWYYELRSVAYVGLVTSLVGFSANRLLRRQRRVHS